MNKYLLEELDTLDVRSESPFDKNNFVTLHPAFYFSFIKPDIELSEKEKRFVNKKEIKILVKKESKILENLIKSYNL
jgi:hypothetical protein